MAWYMVIIVMSAVGCTIQYRSNTLTYSVQTGSDVKITPSIIAVSTNNMPTWVVTVATSHSVRVYTQSEATPCISYVNTIFTIINVTTTARYTIHLDDDGAHREADVNITVYGK